MKTFLLVVAIALVAVAAFRSLRTPAQELSDDGQVIAQFVDSSIICCVSADEDVGVAYNWQLAQYLSQVLWTEFACSASAVTITG